MIIYMVKYISPIIQGALGGYEVVMVSLPPCGAAMLPAQCPSRSDQWCGPMALALNSTELRTELGGGHDLVY